MTGTSYAVYSSVGNLFVALAIKSGIFIYSFFIKSRGILFPNIEPEFIDGLMETDFGEFEYKNHEELKNSRQYINWLKSGGKVGFPSGESFEGFKSRCMEAFYFITGKMEETGINSAAIVTHGGVIMAVLSQLSQKDFYDFHIDNGGCIYGRFNKYKNIFEDIRIL